ncbi:polysaccharide deacetylase family protein [Planctomicrobium sp. SH664]|uniref:polysaccharide deacetylase family protein n=1 Tax=Planctomicrobium sp. SH664 TaxID=3448125 RepID=UPI003F5C5CAD
MQKKQILANTLEFTGLGSLLSLTVGSWNGLVVFNYHRVGDSSQSPFDRALWSATADEFDRQIGFLKKHFDLLNVEDLDDHFHQANSRGVMVTFDDGYRDNYEIALPVLKRHGAPATFFITSGFLDQRLIAWWDEIAWMLHTSSASQLPAFSDSATPLSLESSQDREASIVRILRIYKSLPAERTPAFLENLGQAAGTGRCPQSVADSMWMTWDMVRELHEAGMDIGGHTVSHPVLANTDPASQQREILQSKQRIEQEIGAPITAFSYPVGQPDSFTLQTKQLLHEAGYQWAFSFFGGFCQSAHRDRFALPRVAVSPHVSPALFRAMAKLPWLFA